MKTSLKHDMHLVSALHYFGIKVMMLCSAEGSNR